MIKKDDSILALIIPGQPMYKITLLPWLLVLLACLLLAGCTSAPEKPEPTKLLAFPAPPEVPRFYFERSIVSTGLVKQQDSESRLKQLLTGISSRSGTSFAKPFDIAVHQGRLFISDTVLRLVLVMDFAKGTSFQIGDKGDEGDLVKPLGVAVDRFGNLYVCDGSIKSIHVYDRNGIYLRSIGNREIFDRPSGIDVSPDGSRLYVVDTGGVRSKNHDVKVFDAISGNHLKTIGTRGTKAGEFNLPRDVKLGSDGLLYITDGGNFRVQVLTQEGEFVRTWGKPGAQFGQFSRPKGIAIDKEGNVYVVDAAFGNFQIFNPQGQLLLFVGSRSTMPGAAKYMLPAGIDIDEDGRVYMVDQYFRKIDVYRPAHINQDQGYTGLRESS